MALLTPYVINGAKHPARLFRRQLQLASSGAAGVGRPDDFKVLPLNVPGAGVRVSAGGALIPSRDAGASRETYGVENDAEITFMGEDGEGIPGTGSSGGRRDMVIVEVMDPEMTAVTYPVPSDPDFGAYSQIRVVPGVPSDASRVEDVPALANVTAYGLAIIDWPTSTGTITAAMIKDIRKVAQPLQEVHTRNYEMVSGETSAITSTTAYPQGATWPSHAEVDASWAEIDIPLWATRMRIVMTWNGVLVPGGAARGYVWVQVGLNSNPDRVVTQGRLWNTEREGYRATGTLNVPESMRGTRQGFFPRATRLAGSNATAPVLDASSGLDLLVEFYNDAI